MPKGNKKTRIGKFATVITAIAVPTNPTENKTHTDVPIAEDFSYPSPVRFEYDPALLDKYPWPENYGPPFADNHFDKYPYDQPTFHVNNFDNQPPPHVHYNKQDNEKKDVKEIISDAATRVDTVTLK